MIAPPRNCSGVSTSCSTTTLRSVETTGSRFMVSAVRKAPIRTVEANSASIEMVLQTQTPKKPPQPIPVCGNVGARTTTETTSSAAVDDNIVYHVVNRESAPDSAARVISSV